MWEIIFIPQFPVFICRPERPGRRLLTRTGERSRAAWSVGSHGGTRMSAARARERADATMAVVPRHFITLCSGFGRCFLCWSSRRASSRLVWVGLGWVGHRLSLSRPSVCTE
ncbi:hypothetical protein BKA67DRAFT_48280 [Truncatella angustata]|uniref:Uncharacterized protein n=1 Tax=Truncatella angustata TaxID=152316 RepID=A0A9P9A3D0_9PEZI|nr:uncharacterized protein BKA67DRAFT_48280 [Truncatella angustata]KAH6660332.1 hypothetical protein BKA67DRAFT_48280 [Truncatella angustata]